MTKQLQFNIPSVSGGPTVFSLGVGDVLYLLGANGTGKSSLVSRLFSQYQNDAKRISAHRQTWFASNTLDMTPLNRQNLENNVRSQDAQPQARYREWNQGQRALWDVCEDWGGELFLGWRLHNSLQNRVFRVMHI